MRARLPHENGPLCSANHRGGFAAFELRVISGLAYRWTRAAPLSSPSMRTHYLTVTGMMSGACREKVAEALSVLRGVGHVRVSATHGSVTIHCNEHQISLGEIIAAIEEAGYGIDSAGPAHTHHEIGPLIATAPEPHYK